MTVFKLRTGHNRVNHHHLYSNLCIGHTEQCPCGTGSQTTEHLLQSYPFYEPLRKEIWSAHTPVARKFYSSLGDLLSTATFIKETGISIWQTRRRRSFKCFNETNFLFDLSQQPFQNVFNHSDPEEALMSIIDRHAPIQQRRIKTMKPCTWLSPELICKMNKSNQLKYNRQFDEYEKEIMYQPKLKKAK